MFDKEIAEPTGVLFGDGWESTAGITEGVLQVLTGLVIKDLLSDDV